MIYDDVFSTKTQEAIDGPRRKLNQPVQPPSQASSPAMAGMPSTNSGNLPPVQYGTPDSPFYTPPQAVGFDSGNSWGGLPSPALLQQQSNPAFAAYASGMPPIQQPAPAMMQPPALQQAASPYPQNFAPAPVAPAPMMQQMQAPQPIPSVPYNTIAAPQQLPPVEYAQPLQPQMQPPAAASLPSEQPAFATPQIPVSPQQPSPGQATVGLQAPTYVTPINQDIQQVTAPAPAPAAPMQQAPYQPQMVAPTAPIQQQIIPQQPLQKDEKDRLPISSIEGPAEDPIDKILSPLDENLADKAPSPDLMNSNSNYAQPPPNLYDDNYPEDPEGENSEAQTYEVPIEQVEIEDNNTPPQSLKSQAASEEIDDILKSSSRNAYTPASQLIDKMQVRGKPASLSSVNNNKDTLNTPLGFDAYGEPVIPDSLDSKAVPTNKTQQLPMQPASQQNTSQPREIPNPAAKSIGTEPSKSINSLQQRMDDMRL